MEELKNPQRDSVRRFLERWYGLEGDGEGVGFPEIPESAEIPRELVDWHKLAVATGVSITFQDYPVPPADLTRSDDGMIVFWVENQSGYYWAFETGRKESRVFCRESMSDLWQDSGESLERFLLHCTVQEAIIGAEFKFSAMVPESELQGALADFSVLPFRPFANESPSTRLFCSENALARVAPPPVGYAREGEPSWMLTIVPVPGVDPQEYRRGLEPYILDRDGCRLSAEAFSEDPPF